MANITQKASFALPLAEITKREFNVTGDCYPLRHYMVDISDKIAQISEMVDAGKYFTINRARQYGKTTTLHLLQQALIAKDYTCINIGFDGLDETDFATPEAFCRMFMKHVRNALRYTPAPQEYADSWVDETVISIDGLSDHITQMCYNRLVILLIDEVDQAGNNLVFANFLSMLRKKYLQRNRGIDTTFHSVILAGVYDIKNIKLKMVRSGAHTLQEGEGLYNSPWNIAADFKVNMSFDTAEIASMLREYERDHQTGMDIASVAQEIHAYTDGYPYLVSRICKCIDEELQKDWSLQGIQNAVHIILTENNSLFTDMQKNLENNAELRDYIYTILFGGEARAFVIDDPRVHTGVIYNYFKNIEGRVAISNRIFEIRMSNYFISKGLHFDVKMPNVLANDVITDNVFNMQLCLEKFAKHFQESFNPKTDLPLLEAHGRLLFLTYLKALINGRGFYHIESQLTDLRRMDVVVDYGTDQFIIELKIWDGQSKHHQAYRQLAGYLEAKGAACGYLLTFDLRKSAERQTRAEWVEFAGKRIFDVMV